jgi:hypothetical protein
VERQGPAKPLTAVRFRLAPPKSILDWTKQMKKHFHVGLKNVCALTKVVWQRVRSKPHGLSFLALLLLMVGIANLRAAAQSTFGGIVGTVQDTSGAAVSSAEVSARRVDDGTVRITTSDQTGTYQLLNLKPGRYEVTVARDSFATTRVQEFDLAAREERRIDVRLNPATVQQQVTVSGEGATIDTENGTIADSKSFDQVSALPSNYRGSTGSPLGALVAVPGVQQDSNGALSIGGGMPSMIDFTVDGVSTVNIRNNGANGNMYLSTELLGEFRVTGVNNNAEFAQIADVTVTSKSGSNIFHGSAFDYLQNSALDAQVYGSPLKQQKSFNTFGASLGGPVIIPGLYHGTNKTFFFADYEGNRLRGSTLSQLLVPTQAQRNGDLSDIGGPVIAPADINPVATTYLNTYYPLPNVDSPSANYRSLLPTPLITDGYDVRVDHVLTQRQQIFGRWSWKNLTNDRINNIFTTFDPLVVSSVKEHDRNLILSHNFVIHPNLVNEFRFGISDWLSDEKFPLNGNSVIEGLGLTGLNLANHPESGGFPILDFSSGTGFSVIGRGKDGPTRSKTYQYVDNLSWVKGRHNFKFGGDIRRINYTDVQHFGGADDFGQFVFTGLFTGNAFGDLLEGLPTVTYVAVTGPDLVSPAWRFGFYGQDSFQVNKRLTINLGLRWEFNPPFTEEHGNITNFDRNTNSVIVPDKTLQPSQAFIYSANICPGVVNTLPCSPIVTASQEHLPAGLRQNYLRNFDPRISIAFRPFADDKTVIRGGVGVFTEALTGSSAYVLTGIHATDTQLFFNYQGPGQPPLYQFPAATPGGSGADASSAGSAVFINAQDPDFRDPSSVQWNVTVERQLYNAASLRASYIGMNSYRLPLLVDLNQVHASTTGYDPSQRPYQNWGQVGSLDNLAFANYQALQLEFNHRSNHGLFLQTSYTLAKNLTNAEGDIPTGFAQEYGAVVSDRFSLSSNRGNDVGTRRNRFLANVIYELPFGRGRTFLPNLGPVANAVLGGWQISTITLFETGPFLTPAVSAINDPANINDSGRQIISIRPDQVGDGNVSNPTPDHWFNINAFVATPPNSGRQGNAGVGTLVGPGTVASAVGLSKAFQLGERARLRLEGSFTNLFNHPNFAPPGTDISSPATFGVTTAVQTAENAGNRTGQLALRLEF